MDDHDLIEQNIDEYLRRHQQKELLRFVAVGSVDDGKSTLIGRLLHDTHGVYEDQLSAVKRASKQGSGEIDYSLFTDGLKAEREQGITIDVAYRYFSTHTRKFIIADTPGHVQYTRNMATGASTADLAIILIDARLGVLQQSRRHAFIASLLGIPRLTVCVNKMDLVAFDEATYERIRRELTEFTSRLGFDGVDFIPVSALAGDNVVAPSERAPWYSGPTLLQHLETVEISGRERSQAFRFPVQSVLRPNLDYRGFAGQISAGSVRVGDEIMVLPSRKTSRIRAIDTFDGELQQAAAPMSVALRLSDEVDVSRGDMLVHPAAVPRVARRFHATLVWMSERALDPQRSYLLKHTTQYVRAEIERVAHTIDLETLEPVPATHLELNDIGKATLVCHRPLFVDAYTDSRASGAFVLIDSITNNTVAAGMISRGELPDTGSVPAPALGRLRSSVSQAERREKLGQSGCTVWLTGLPASGKSSIAYALERLLFDHGKLGSVIDPNDDVTGELGPRGASPPHAPLVARRLTDAGLIAIFAFDSPLASDRAHTRAVVGEGRFFEVYVATPLDVCRTRDTHGVYDRAHGTPLFEPPGQADVVVSAEHDDADSIARAIVAALQARGLI
ncbi:MAG: sulfate adenylyltransferase subunit CysN [Myxococcales bacterium]|nr:sulfate adenylyltransferase subunit CysN [Myxococcales bacterium]